MNQLHQSISSGRCIWKVAGALAGSAVFSFGVFAGLPPALENNKAASEREISSELAWLESGAKIECVTPDGRRAPVLLSQNENGGAAVSVLEKGTLRCPLQEGETTFLISFPKCCFLDRLKFLNENAAASGQLKIAVANEDLPVASPKWTAVDGAIAFSHKRLLNLSMVGVEARYVKLSFQVEKAERLVAPDLHERAAQQKFAAR